MKFLRRFTPVIALLVLVAAYGLVWSNREAILDWVALRNYSPPASIVSLADQDTMTPLARHYLFVNRPLLADRDVFNKHCTKEHEQSIVLGCYTGNRKGIYVYNITDKELFGVQQVTTAHEMLHQAYDRLDTSERNRIDGLLQDYYRHSLTDASVKAQIAEYQKTEPDAIDNEMHSLFGTEIAQLPSELEDYYKQYFTDRGKVAAFYGQYQAAFTTRKAQIATYDAQLASWKPQIQSAESSLQQQLANLNALRSEMSGLRTSNPSAYNDRVAGYNAAVQKYNTDLDGLKALIAQYNDVVDKRNAIADQEKHLQQSLSSKSLPDTTEQ